MKYVHAHVPVYALETLESCVSIISCKGNVVRCKTYIVYTEVFPVCYWSCTCPLITYILVYVIYTVPYVCVLRNFGSLTVL